MRSNIVDIGDMVKVLLGHPDALFVGLVVDITEDGEPVEYYTSGEYSDYYDYSVLFFGDTVPMCVYSSEIVEIVSKIAS